MVGIVGLLLGLVSQLATEPPYHTGPRFRRELETPASGAWTNVPLRTLLRDLATQHGVAILLDRRIDPTLRLPLEITNQPLKEGLEGMAARVGAQTSLTQNVVYIGPGPARNRLRTLIELRTAELQPSAAPQSDRRRRDLLRRQTVSWEDLTSPREVLTQLAERWSLTLRDLDKHVPHDLWAGATLPEVTAIEALSLVLIQFDLTFQWDRDGQTVLLIPAPETVAVERKLRPRGRSAQEFVTQLEARFPGVETRIAGADVLVRSTVEVHESVADWMNPTARKPAAPTPLRQRTFTLTFRRAPVADVLRKLEESGIVFDYDRQAFAAAGIDFSHLIDLDLNQASAEDFLRALFAPFPLAFEIDQVTVRLRLK